jgi:hypothetical protein
MAKRFPGGGAARVGGAHPLRGKLPGVAGFPRAPSWRLNLGDVYIPPLLVGAAALEEEI